MSIFYDRLRDFFTGKNVLILGFGREGRSTLALLNRFGCRVTIADRNEISGTGDVSVITGEHYLDCLPDYDIIMKAPGIALFNSVPDEIKKRITCQTDLLLRFCPNHIIGVTGTKGKSTTSSLIHHILTSCGKDAVLIGNIGVPPLDCVNDLTDDTTVVCEMSCHQLEYVQASPNIAVYLNLFEEHLDHYVDFNAYKAAKENIYRFARSGDVLIINKALCEGVCVPSLTFTASLTEDADICVKDGAPVILGTKYPVKTKLLGEHNLYNIGIAMFAAGLTGNMRAEEIAASVSTFDGLKHRLENIGTVNGVTYINDSISTCPSTAIAAVRSFENVDTIIIGGMDRGIDYTELVEFINASELRNVILLPDSGHKIEPRLDHDARCIFRAADMKEAVAFAGKAARNICLLSPAAASYGFYKNFEERGDHFRKLVAELA